MELRPYQTELINKLKLNIKNGNRKVCLVSGCGSGKSVIIGNIAKCATLKKSRVLFLVHRKELLEQIRNTFNVCNVDMNYCELGMVQTLNKRLSEITKPDIIIVDEAHHILSNTYIQIIEHFNNSIVIGFTATPVRLAEGGLGKVFESMVTGVTTNWLIDNKYLAPYKYFSVELATHSGLNVMGGDYKKEQIASLMEKQKIYGDTLENWERIAKGKKTIIYCASIKSSIETVKKFQQAGHKAEHLDGTTPKALREEVMQKFRSGEITVISNMELFSEGLDISDCECVILLRPTKSLSLFIQQSMRSMRIDPNNPEKVAIIIDHVKNIYEHGFPDEEREWSLKAKKAKKKCEVPIKQCIKCFMVMNSIKRQCEFCGYELVNEERYEIEKVDMELKQLKRQDILQQQHHDYYKNLQTFSQLVEFQKEKKYKFAWTLRKAQEMNMEIPSKYKYMLDKYINKKF